jgi:hypothetical protein
MLSTDTQNHRTTTDVSPRMRGLADDLVIFLETGTPPAGLFAADMFLDFTMPTWRLQADTAEGAVAVRLAGHPVAGEVPRSRLDAIAGGFLFEFEERWHDRGEEWYCREMIRADVGETGITHLAVYCTGDWDTARRAEHAAAVTLLRP